MSCVGEHFGATAYHAVINHNQPIKDKMNIRYTNLNTNVLAGQVPDNGDNEMMYLRKIIVFN